MKYERDLQPEMLDAILEALPMDLTIIDADDRVIAWNDFRSLFGIGEEVMGNDVRACHPQESLPALEGMLEDMRKGRMDSTRSVKEVDKRGERRRFLIQYTAIRSHKGEYLGCLEIDMDLTDLPPVGEGEGY